MERKNVGIITRHFISNYGSFLQCYATIRTLDSLGYNGQIINYIPNEENIKNDGDFTAKKKKLSNFKKLIYNLFVTPQHKKSAKKFENYREKYLNCSPQYDESSISNCKYDIYMSGSDQLWGPIGTNDYDLNYFLKFTDSPNKIAYSSSFGYSSFNKKYDSIFKQELLKFKAISVREASACDYLTSIGIPSTLVLDPTFFLSKSNYKKESDGFFIKEKPTILIYQLHHESIAKKFGLLAAKEINGTVLSILPNPARYVPFSHIKVVYNPFEFLAYIDNAKFIITDSFHATVFSIIYNKQFIAVNPGNTATRIKNILNLLGLSERYQENPTTVALLNKINYNDVNMRLNTLVNSSKKTLLVELNKCK